MGIYLAKVVKHVFWHASAEVADECNIMSPPERVFELVLSVRPDFTTFLVPAASRAQMVATSVACGRCGTCRLLEMKISF